MKTGYIGEDNTDAREMRRVRQTDDYKQAEAHAQRFMQRLASFLSAGPRGFTYHYGKTTRTLRDVGEADISVTALPTLGPRGNANGESFTVRIYGPRPDSAIVYAASMKDSPKQAQSVYRRLERIIGRTRGGLKRRKQPTIMQAANERVATTAGIFGCRAVCRNGQAKVSLPGGAMMHVSGERDHSVHIDHLTDEQLNAVLRAIASTLEPIPEGS